MQVTLDGMLPYGVFVCLLAGAAYDLRFHRIPNSLTLGGAAVGFFANIATHQLAGAVTSIEGWVLGLVILIVPFAMRGVGGGDVKLLAAAGAWGGPDYAFSTALYGAIVGAIIAIVLLLINGRLLETIRPMIVWLRTEITLMFSSVPAVATRWLPAPAVSAVTQPGVRGKLKFAYGPALAIGGIAALVIH